VIVVDTNVLVHAYDTAAPRHQDARRWWEAVLSSNEPVGVPWVVVLAFTRLLTHPTICERPVTTETVRQIVGSWLDLLHVRLLYRPPVEEPHRVIVAYQEA
jgi:predicted nucleic acid-binding protein